MLKNNITNYIFFHDSICFKFLMNCSKKNIIQQKSLSWTILRKWQDHFWNLSKSTKNVSYNVVYLYSGVFKTLFKTIWCGLRFCEKLIKCVCPVISSINRLKIISIKISYKFRRHKWNKGSCVVSQWKCMSYIPYHKLIKTC